MMHYRQLPHGSEREKFSVLGLGLGGIGQTPADEIEAIIRKAIDNGINFFDMCTAGATYAPMGRAIAGRRESILAWSISTTIWHWPVTALLPTTTPSLVYRRTPACIAAIARAAAPLASSRKAGWQ